VVCPHGQGELNQCGIFINNNNVYLCSALPLFTFRIKGSKRFKYFVVCGQGFKKFLWTREEEGVYAILFGHLLWTAPYKNVMKRAVNGVSFKNTAVQ